MRKFILDDVQLSMIAALTASAASKSIKTAAEWELLEAEAMSRSPFIGSSQKAYIDQMVIQMTIRLCIFTDMILGGRN